MSWCVVVTEMCTWCVFVCVCGCYFKEWRLEGVHSRVLEGKMKAMSLLLRLIGVTRASVCDCEWVCMGIVNYPLLSNGVK